MRYKAHRFGGRGLSQVADKQPDEYVSCGHGQGSGTLDAGGESLDDSTATAAAERWGKILSELERRRWKSIRIKSLDKAQRRNIRDLYLEGRTK